MTAQAIQALLLGIIHQDKTMAEIARMTGTEPSTALKDNNISNVLRHFSRELKRNKSGPGAGLIDYDYDRAVSLREKRVTLLPPGRTWVNRIRSIIEG